MKTSKKSQAGFVLAVSMIFLVIMTVLAITAIKKATLDEKITGNLRTQDMAFQAAEKALRFCESWIELRAGNAKICQARTGAIVLPTTLEFNPADVTANFPIAWQNMANWTGSGGLSTELSGTDAMTGVASQPRCMVERWEMPGERPEDAQLRSPYVITARGVGSVSTAVVWLQEVIRCGNT